MNLLTGTITKIIAAEDIFLLDINCQGISVSCIHFDRGFAMQQLSLGSRVKVSFKEIATSLASAGPFHISIPNRIPGSIVSLVSNTILTRVRLQAQGQIITAQILKRSAEELKLEVGLEAIALVKATDVTLEVSQAL